MREHDNRCSDITAWHIDHHLANCVLHRCSSPFHFFGHFLDPHSRLLETFGEQNSKKNPSPPSKRAYARTTHHFHVYLTSPESLCHLWAPPSAEISPVALPHHACTPPYHSPHPSSRAPRQQHFLPIPFELESQCGREAEINYRDEGRREIRSTLTKTKNRKSWQRWKRGVVSLKVQQQTKVMMKDECDDNRVVSGN